MDLRSWADWWGVVRRGGADPRPTTTLHPGPLSRHELDRLEGFRQSSKKQFGERRCGYVDWE